MATSKAVVGKQRVVMCRRLSLKYVVNNCVFVIIQCGHHWDDCTDVSIREVS